MTTIVIPKGFVPTKGTYTKSETAEYLRVSIRTVENFISRGLLRKSCALRRVLIRSEDVETFLSRTGQAAWTDRGIRARLSRCESSRCFSWLI